MPPWQVLKFRRGFGTQRWRQGDLDIPLVAPMASVALEVLLSQDLIPHVFASLQWRDRAAAAVCTAWSTCWDAFVSTRIPPLRDATPLQTPEELHNYNNMEIAVLPGGEQLAIMEGQLHVVDIQNMRVQRTHAIGNENLTDRLTVGANGIYIGEMNPSRVQRHRLDTFEIAAVYEDPGRGISDLALAPGGILFVVSWDDDDGTSCVRALDALSLALRFTIPSEVVGGDGANVAHWPGHPGYSLLSDITICGDELVVGCRSDSTIRMLSTTGLARRIIPSIASHRLCSAGRLLFVNSGEVRHCRRYNLHLVDRVATVFDSRCIVVLSPCGTILQEYKPPDSLNTDLGQVMTGRPSLSVSQQWESMCTVNGKLIMHEQITWKSAEQESRTNKLKALELSLLFWSNLVAV